MNAKKAAPPVSRGDDVIVFVSFNVFIFIFFFHGLDSVVEGKNADFRVVFSYFPRVLNGSQTSL